MFLAEQERNSFPLSPRTASEFLYRLQNNNRMECQHQESGRNQQITSNQKKGFSWILVLNTPVHMCWSVST